MSIVAPLSCVALQNTYETLTYHALSATWPFNCYDSALLVSFKAKVLESYHLINTTHISGVNMQSLLDKWILTSRVYDPAYFAGMLKRQLADGHPYNYVQLKVNVFFIILNVRLNNSGIFLRCL